MQRNLIYQRMSIPICLFLLVGITVFGRRQGANSAKKILDQAGQRQEVLFWHFWGGRDRQVVEDVAQRFNESQNEYFVRAVAMPGNNLQAKLFLSVTGGDPPDLVNQDDPILADWAARGVIQSIEQVAPENEIAELRSFLFESAERLSVIDNEYFAVCNGLDIRALYFNQTLLEKYGLPVPRTLEQLDQTARALSPPGDRSDRKYFGYLPDSRRLWAWGYVFGGKFYDETNNRVIVSSESIVAALNWMQSYSDTYGADNLVAFRQGDQSLPGKTFPLLPISDEDQVGRYGLIMDGQWRTRDIAEFTRRRQENGIDCPKFGVCPLPYPDGGRVRSGWVNGNFFVIPTGAKCSAGAWEFIKFWIGMTDPTEAAKTCADGGWIPVSQQVVNTIDFQAFVESNQLFGEFVDLAGSPEQYPTPLIPGAAMFKRTVEAAAYDAMTQTDLEPSAILESTSERIQQHLERIEAGQ